MIKMTAQRFPLWEFSEFYEPPFITLGGIFHFKFRSPNPWDWLKEKSELLASSRQIYVDGIDDWGQYEIYKPWNLGVADGVEIPETAKIEDSLIGKDVKVGPGAYIKNSIVMDGAKISAGAQALDSIIFCEARLASQAVTNNRTHHQEEVYLKIVQDGVEQKYQTGRDKFGAIVGKQARVVARLEPGTAIGMYSFVQNCHPYDQPRYVPPRKRVYVKVENGKINLVMEDITPVQLETFDKEGKI